MTEEPVETAPETPATDSSSASEPAPDPVDTAPAAEPGTGDSPFDQPRMEVITASIGPDDTGTQLNLDQSEQRSEGNETPER